jgi:cell division protein FtsL
MKDKDFEQQGEDHARAERILAAAKALEIERDPKELLKEERISIIANSVRGGMKE